MKVNDDGIAYKIFDNDAIESEITAQSLIDENRSLREEVQDYQRHQKWLNEECCKLKSENKHLKSNLEAERKLIAKHEGMIRRAVVSLLPGYLPF